MKIKFMIDNFKVFLHYLNGLQLKLKINIIKTFHTCSFQNLALWHVFQLNLIRYYNIIILEQSNII